MRLPRAPTVAPRMCVPCPCFKGTALVHEVSFSPCLCLHRLQRDLFCCPTSTALFPGDIRPSQPRQTYPP